MSNGLYTKAEFERLVLDIGDVVSKYSRAGSARAGLTAVAIGFGALLDIYAAPDPENPQGMCDDKAAFRKYFAEIIANPPADPNEYTAVAPCCAPAGRGSARHHRGCVSRKKGGAR